MFKRCLYGLLSVSMLLTSLLFTSLTQAQAIDGYQSCNVDLHNEVHLDGKGVRIIDAKGHKAIIDEKKGLSIEGKTIELSHQQQQALDQYRKQLNETIPKVQEVGRSGVALANEVLDDVSAKFNNTHAFDNVRQAISDFYVKLEKRYHHDGEWVLKPNALSAMHNNWQKDLADARQVFNTEFIASAFTVMQEKFAAEGSVNFTELQNEMVELQTSIKKKLKAHSSEITEKAQNYCDSMDQLAKEEQSVVKTIPELKKYQLFNI
ncbi:chemotaxis protein [Vibrio sp. UCD-FRSSP16_10]|uniref:DUF2884 family protein n=1 Tax=unclassified Vibrio TaxID=2614977 RepID=UPI0007FC92CD|nr:MULTISPECIES: DUF2884 family protein [unclassified Vibrio]OBT06542.1 chemotaxis protein [Vibrio sp. UCD-FRSSP16_30]OBT12239.1 chemotaxis protein [Vibrio sp. UCD-FRSSP16_10]